MRLSALFPHRFLILTPSVRILPLFQHKLAVIVLFVRVFALFKHGLAVFVLYERMKNSSKALVELRFITDIFVDEIFDRKTYNSLLVNSNM